MVKGKVVPVLNHLNSKPKTHMEMEVQLHGPATFTPGGKRPCARRLSRPQNRSACCGVENNILPLPGIEPSPKPVAVSTELSLLVVCVTLTKNREFTLGWLNSTQPIVCRFSLAVSVIV
jgi:hypothetical protein